MAFRLKCKAKLKNDLGRYDAIVEFTEIAIRDFIKSSEETKSFDQYLKQKSTEHQIRVDSIDKGIFKTRIALGYIISVFQSFELFLREFKEEYCELYDVKWNLPDSKENLLRKIISKVSSLSKAKNVIGESNIELFDYYRKIRNKYVHDYIDKEKIDKAYKKIKKQEAELKIIYPNLNAPNDFENISFDDFILFTRAVKEIANGLCSLIEPENEIVLVDYYKRTKLYSKFKDKPERKIGAIKHDLNFRFGITENIDSIVKNIMSQ